MERILLLFILLSKTNKGGIKGLFNITEYISSMEIDVKYTEEKIHLAKKITPLMPLEYIDPIIRSIYITESLVKIKELKDYTNTNISTIQTVHIPVKDNKERISKIVSIIKEEMPNSNMNHIGTVLELVVNLDKYKKMFELLNTITKNQNLKNDKDKLLNLVEPLMKNKGSSEGEALDIERLINIISLLNKPKVNIDKNETEIEKATDLKSEDDNNCTMLNILEDEIFQTKKPNEI